MISQYFLLRSSHNNFSVTVWLRSYLLLFHTFWYYCRLLLFAFVEGLSIAIFVHVRRNIQSENSTYFLLCFPWCVFFSTCSDFSIFALMCHTQHHNFECEWYVFQVCVLIFSFLLCAFIMISLNRWISAIFPITIQLNFWCNEYQKHTKVILKEKHFLETDKYEKVWYEKKKILHNEIKQLAKAEHFKCVFCMIRRIQCGGCNAVFFFFHSMCALRMLLQSGLCIKLLQSEITNKAQYAFFFRSFSQMLRLENKSQCERDEEIWLVCKHFYILHSMWNVVILSNISSLNWPNEFND